MLRGPSLRRLIPLAMFLFGIASLIAARAAESSPASRDATQPPDASRPMTLPIPHYDFEASDPEFLHTAVQFHGHLGPWAAAGLRIGHAGLNAVGAKGYFDIEVTAIGPFEKPPVSCFLDGLQVSTGATWGKRNIHAESGANILVRFTNTETGKTVTLRPSPALLQLARSLSELPAGRGEPTSNAAAPAAGPVNSAATKHAAANDAAIHGAPTKVAASSAVAKEDTRHDPRVEAIARQIANLPERDVLADPTEGQ